MGKLFCMESIKAKQTEVPAFDHTVGSEQSEKKLKNRLWHEYPPFILFLWN